MRIKVIIIGLIVTSLTAGSYFYYQYNYVQTLMLSEIVGKTDNSLANIAVNIFDFDTGLTRHDISQLKSKKDYWVKRTNEVESITDPTLKQEESLKLIDEMLEDPTMKKIFKGTLTLSSDLLDQILSSL